ncbi:hypothetical protein DFH09DRAFT_1004193 [Mycena vulgaris]|nr:hypothetical protein DFH09DRAFT_1004193 [Mycena vulgaris]
MAPITNSRVVFAAIPKDYPIPGETTVYDTTQTIDLDGAPLNGGFLIKTLVLSIDPYMRGRMRKPEIESYMPAFLLGDAIEGLGIGVVLRSENPDVAVGKYIYGSKIREHLFHANEAHLTFVSAHQEYSVILTMEGFTFIEKHPKLPLTVYAGSAGMAGKTAYMAWKELAKAKKGETAFVTTGAGPVGSMVIQLAKRDGLRVIASAGSDEKVAFMKEVGADVAFNYKTTNISEVLAREGPINVYWDNVGGETLDAALEHAALYARFVMCGTISGYNSDAQGIKNIDQIFAKSLSLNGFLTFRLEQKYDAEFYATIPSALASGEIKYREDVTRGLETVGDSILRVQQGKNKGKAVVIVADE